MTLAEVIRARGGYTSGFDYLRLVLAVLVIYWHSFLITRSLLYPEGWLGWLLHVRNHLILPMFFSLSGFLVAASLLRVEKLWHFVALRGLRIGPALLVEVLVSALILGPLLTTVSLPDYFGAPAFRHYFLNIVGWPHYLLPGLFVDNPSPNVNGSLWTVPYEAECYLALSALWMVGLVGRPRLFAILVCLALVVLTACALLGHDPLDSPLARGTLTGRQLVLCFLVSVALYLNRDIVPHSRTLFVVALVIALATVSVHRLAYVAMLPVAYATAILGLTVPRKVPLLFGGDYSYGIYLYGAPIQQAVQNILRPTSAYVTFVASLPFIFAVAMTSWHLVEKPTLGLKRRLIPKAKRTPHRAASDEMISPDKSDPAVAEALDGETVPLPRAVPRST